MAGYSESGAKNRLHFLYINDAGTVVSGVYDCTATQFSHIMAQLPTFAPAPEKGVCGLCNGRGYYNVGQGFNTRAVGCTICGGVGVV